MSPSSRGLHDLALCWPRPMLALGTGPDLRSSVSTCALGHQPATFAFAASAAGRWIDQGLDRAAEKIPGQARQAFPDHSQVSRAGSRRAAERRATFVCRPGAWRPRPAIAPGLRLRATMSRSLSLDTRGRGEVGTNCRHRGVGRGACIGLTAWPRRCDAHDESGFRHKMRAHATRKEPFAPAIQVIERLFSLLDALAAHQDPVTLKELERGHRPYPSTAHRILNDLTIGRYVDRPEPGPLTDWACEIA